ncbi:MAG: hypothetical protein AAGA30_17670 [Planctomycetota bacterium]
MKLWMQYQDDTATFYRILGLQAVVEARVNGTRGKHNLDVYVKWILYSIQFVWIVECKARRSNITKKVMALAAIVEDEGADSRPRLLTLGVGFPFRRHPASRKEEYHTDVGSGYP